MGLYPINLEIKDKLCVVVGGGRVAQRKVESLLAAGAKVKVISPIIKKEDLPASLNASQRRQAGGRGKSEEIEIVKRIYQKGDLAGAFLAIAATDDEDVNKQIAMEANESGVLLNVVDKPELCHFFVPSVVKRGDLVFSISTSGKFPALSKKLRKRLEEEFGPDYEKYLDLLAAARDKVIAKYADLSKRKARLQEIADLPILELVKQGKLEEAQEEIEKVVGVSTPDSRLPTPD